MNPSERTTPFETLIDLLTWELPSDEGTFKSRIHKCMKEHEVWHQGRAISKSLFKNKEGLIGELWATYFSCINLEYNMNTKVHLLLKCGLLRKLTKCSMDPMVLKNMESITKSIVPAHLKAATEWNSKVDIIKDNLHVQVFFANYIAVSSHPAQISQQVALMETIPVEIIQSYFEWRARLGHQLFE